MFACYYQCKEDKLCQSLNFYEKSNLCELNNRTRAVGSVNFVSKADTIYLDNPFRGKLLINSLLFFLHFYKFHLYSLIILRKLNLRFARETLWSGFKLRKDLTNTDLY